MMSVDSTEPIFFNKKKNKDWTSRTLATSNPPTSDNNSFLPYLPQGGHHMCVTPIVVGFKISVIIRLPLQGLLTFITNFTYWRLQKYSFFMQNKCFYRISSFYEKRIDTAED